MFNPKTIRQDFPIFKRRMNGYPLTFLDSASTTQKPKSVMNALKKFYETTNANIHRGIYEISVEATDLYEKTRETVKNFIQAREACEIIFTRNTTEGINLVAYTWARKNIQKGDVILVSALEHHSNLVPWQVLCKEKEAKLEVIPLNGYELDLKSLDILLTKKVKLVAITHASNVTGVIVPIEKIIPRAHKIGAKVLIDGAQSVAHIPINVQKLDCDFLVFSSHKMLGPTGVGILYGKKEILEEMPPFLYGGDMIKEVKQHSARWNDIPWKFEAGTPNIADVIAFKEAIKYLRNLGMENILAHDQKLLAYAKSKLANNPNIEIYLPEDTSKYTGILSFNVKGVHAHDTAQILNEYGICIRAGHHCCQPLLERLKVPATARMSFYIYNTEEEIDRALQAIKKISEIFQRKPDDLKKRTSYNLQPTT